MRVANTVLDLIGNTPLVRLNRVTGDIGCTVLVKVEYVNPGASSKDRIAERIIDAAEREGTLTAGGTIVEPTSGNTGIGLALVAQQRGYRCVFVCPDKVSEDKINTLRAYGAEVVVCPTNVAPDDPESYYSVSDRLARDIPGAYKPDQYSNPNGPLSHYETTGPEVWRDTDGTVTHFVAGVGTGGTISGAGRYLKEVSNGRVRVIGADPEGSVYSGGTGRPYLVEGVGEDFWPTAYDPSIVDEVIVASDAESFELTRRLAREEGLLVGGSSGMAVAAGLKAAANLAAGDVMVILLPDGGRGYLGKIFNDRWMRDHGFLPAAETPTVGDVLLSMGVTPAELPHVRKDVTVREAIGTLRRHAMSHLPVLSARPPVVLGEVAGSIDEASLIAALASGEVLADDPLVGVIQPELPIIGFTASVAEAQQTLATTDVLVVVSEGKPVGLLNRPALLAYLAA